MAKISRLRLKILDYLIEKGDDYNESISKNLQEFPTNVWRMLGRMEQEGYVTIYFPKSTGLSDRRNLIFYKITDAGRKYFNEHSDYLDEFSITPKKIVRRGK